MGTVLCIAGSDDVDAVMRRAVDVARPGASRLLVLAVPRATGRMLTGAIAWPELYPVYREMHDERFGFLARVVGAVPADLPVTTICCDRSPRRILREALQAHPVSVVVVGRRRRVLARRCGPVEVVSHRHRGKVLDHE